METSTGTRAHTRGRPAASRKVPTAPAAENHRSCVLTCDRPRAPSGPVCENTEDAAVGWAPPFLWTWPEAERKAEAREATPVMSPVRSGPLLCKTAATEQSEQPLRVWEIVCRRPPGALVWPPRAGGQRGASRRPPLSGQPQGPPRPRQRPRGGQASLHWDHRGDSSRCPGGHSGPSPPDSGRGSPRCKCGRIVHRPHLTNHFPFKTSQAGTQTPDQSPQTYMAWPPPESKRSRTLT